MSSPFCCESEIGTAFGIPNCPLTDAKKKDVRRSRIEAIALHCFMVVFLANRRMVISCLHTLMFMARLVEVKNANQDDENYMMPFTLHVPPRNELRIMC